MDRRVVAIGVCALLSAGTVAGPARADEFPPRKAGLWQVDMTMSMAQMPPQQMKMCIDPGTDAEMYKLGISASQGMCDKPDLHRSGNTVTVSTMCKMGDSQISTTAVTKFTGDTAYHTEAHTKMTPAPAGGSGETTITQEAKWVGPCPADMVAGDVVMGNGMKMNIKQMLGGTK